MLNMFNTILTRVRGLLQRARVSREMDDELRFHLEMEAQSHVAQGISPEEARRRALRDLGGVDQTKEAIRDVRASWIDSAWQDLRYAVRSFRRQPGAAVAAVGMWAWESGSRPRCSRSSTRSSCARRPSRDQTSWRLSTWATITAVAPSSHRRSSEPGEVALPLPASSRRCLRWRSSSSTVPSSSEERRSSRRDCSTFSEVSGRCLVGSSMLQKGEPAVMTVCCCQKTSGVRSTMPTHNSLAAAFPSTVNRWWWWGSCRPNSGFRHGTP